MRLSLTVAVAKEMADDAQGIQLRPTSRSGTPLAMRCASSKGRILLLVPTVILIDQEYTLQWLLIGMIRQSACFSMTM